MSGIVDPEITASEVINRNYVVFQKRVPFFLMGALVCKKGWCGGGGGLKCLVFV